MSLPYYKRFPRDFLEGSIGLSFEEKGAYAIVLDLIYMRNGSLPDDARYIAGQLGCSVRLWSKIKDALVSKGKISVINGIISNFRANYQLEETRKYQDKQAENRTKTNENNKLQKPSFNHSRDYPEPEPDTNIDDDVSAGASVSDFGDWPEPRDTVGELTRCASIPAAEWQLHTVRELVRWRQAGFSFRQDVIPAVEAVWLKVRQRPPKSWAYFTDAIAQHHANRLDRKSVV